MTDLLLWNSIKLCSSLFQMQILRCLRLVILCWVCQMSDKINCLLVLLLGRVIAILDRYVIENVLIFEAHGVKPLKMQAACFFNVYLILTICINVYMQWSIGLDIRCIETFPCKRCGREEDINCWFVEMPVVVVAAYHGLLQLKCLLIRECVLSYALSFSTYTDVYAKRETK